LSQINELSLLFPAEKGIKKTVIRSTDPTTSSTPPVLLRTIQGSSLFKSNIVVPTSTSQTQSLAITKYLPGDFQKLTANKRVEIQSNGGTTTTTTSTTEQQQQQQQQLTTVTVTPRSGRRRRRRALTICLAHCRYDIVRKTSEKFGLIEVSEDQPWNIYWTDYSVSLERAVEMRRYQVSLWNIIHLVIIILDDRITLLYKLHYILHPIHSPYFLNGYKHVVCMSFLSFR